MAHRVLIQTDGTGKEMSHSFPLRRWNRAVRQWSVLRVKGSAHQLNSYIRRFEPANFADSHFNFPKRLKNSCIVFSSQECSIDPLNNCGVKKLSRQDIRIAI